MLDSPPRGRRPRRGSLELPISARIYRAFWIALVIPVLIAAFSVRQPSPLPEPALPPSFDSDNAFRLATEFAQRFPDRSPGSEGSENAANWVADQFSRFGLPVVKSQFVAKVPGLGARVFVNLAAVVPADSPQAIVVMAHRDNLGLSPGADDNASGTAALLELARNVVLPEEGQATPQAHTLVFLSTDGAVYGGLGAAAFARDPRGISGLIGMEAAVRAVINLDAIAGARSPRLEFAADTSRSPAPSLLATAEASLLEHAGVSPSRPGPFEQLLDLAFPFSLYEQAPFISRGIPAVTLTRGGSRPGSPYHDTTSTVTPDQLGSLGLSAAALLTSLDDAVDVARGTDSHIFLGTRIIRGWAIELILLVALLPFIAAVLDLFAWSRRHRVALLPALRSLRSRLGVWLWAGGVFGFLSLTDVFPRGERRPITPETAAAGDWPVAGVLALVALSAVGWLFARPRLVPLQRTQRAEQLGGHLAAMLALGIVALVVAATNPFALVFVLPSLHAWLWIPLFEEQPYQRLLLYSVGLAGPVFLLVSFGVRFGLGFDAPWYVLALASIGYIQIPLVLAFLAWGAAAGQVAAVAAGRYAPYPAPSERRRGPIRETLRQAILLRRRVRRRRSPDIPTHDVVEDRGDPASS